MLKKHKLVHFNNSIILELPYMPCYFDKTYNTFFVLHKHTVVLLEE